MTSGHSLSEHRILVPGASGYIGSALCRALGRVGAEVHGVSRTPQNAKNSIARWWQCQLDDIEAVRLLLRTIKPDWIFHLAGNTAAARALSLVIPTFYANLASTVNLLTAATEIGCGRILLTGSMEEPDAGPDWPVPSSSYAAAKFAAGTYGRMFHALYDTPAVILRVFMVYGPGQKDLNKLIPYVTLSLLKGETPQLSSGVREVDWIYVDDVVEGYLAAALAQGVEGDTIDIGTGRLDSVRTVVEHLFDIVRPGTSPAFESIADRPMEQTRTANVERSLQQIAWGAQTTLRDGLRRTVDWYRERILRGVY